MNCPIKLDVLFSCSICAAVDDQIQFSVSSFAPGLDLALIDITNLQCKCGQSLMWKLCQQQCANRSKIFSFRSVLRGICAVATKLYELGLAKVDAESQARIKRFYHKADSNRKSDRAHNNAKNPNVPSGCLIGRLLPRILLHRHGIAWEAMEFGKTPSGKPFIASKFTYSHIFCVNILKPFL